MIRKIFVVIFLLAVVISFPALYLYHDQVTAHILESLLNQYTGDVFDGSLRLKGVNLTKDLKLTIDRIEGTLIKPVTRKSFFPLEVSSFRSDESFFNLFLKHPLHFRFENFRPVNSKTPGISGVILYDPAGEGSFELTAKIKNLNLQDLIALNPDTLAGSSGEIAGDIRLSSDFGTARDTFAMVIQASEAGGTLQARFFDAFIPYLPKVQREQIQTILQGTEIVGFKQARLQTELVSKENLKILLSILIPDYNLNLNLNVEIRLEKGSSFDQIAQLMGLAEIKLS